MYLVRISFVLSSVSPSRKAKIDGLRRGFAKPIMLSHCSAVAKLGKYNARGYQLKTYKQFICPHFLSANENSIFDYNPKLIKLFITIQEKNIKKQQKPEREWKLKNRHRSCHKASNCNLSPTVSLSAYYHHHSHAAKKFKNNLVNFEKLKNPIKVVDQNKKPNRGNGEILPGRGGRNHRSQQGRRRSRRSKWWAIRVCP